MDGTRSTRLQLASDTAYRPGRARPGPVAVEVLSRAPITRHGIRALLREFPDRILLGAPPVDVEVVLFELAVADHGDRRALAYLMSQPAAVVAIVPLRRPDLVEVAVELGVGSCVVMSISAPDLVDVVEVAAAGVRGTWRRDSSRTTARGLGAGLGAREEQIVRLIAGGLSNDEIAARLYLGRNTVKTHIRTAYRKIGVRSRAQAVLWVLTEGVGASSLPYPLASYLSAVERA